MILCNLFRVRVDLTIVMVDSNTFAARLIQVIHTKIKLFACTLQRCKSGTESGRELFKSSKDAASIVCIQKKFFWLGGTDFL